jgi:hypothetical protein
MDLSLGETIIKARNTEKDSLFYRVFHIEGHGITGCFVSLELVNINASTIIIFYHSMRLIDKLYL